MTMRPLTAVAVEGALATQPGPPPDMAWLPLAQLAVNSAYQRDITRQGEATIGRIARGFSWAKFSPVIVTRIPGNIPFYEIIDGQHRSTAAFVCGYDKVPCYIVKGITGEEAARIFAAVNGNVTAMSAQSVYKAALAGGERWAKDMTEAAQSAGVTILTHATTARLQKPGQTLSVGSLRKLYAVHGKAVVAATLRLLMAGTGSEAPGYLSSRLIVSYGRVLAARPGWVTDIATVCRVVSGVNLALSPADMIEARIARAIGDGRSTGDGWEDIKAKVGDLLSRRSTPQMIAGQLKLPYASVQRAIAEIKG
jgi:hypothetical protein